jgi:hypothetical protein
VKKRENKSRHLVSSTDPFLSRSLQILMIPPRSDTQDAQQISRRMKRARPENALRSAEPSGTAKVLKEGSSSRM